MESTILTRPIKIGGKTFPLAFTLRAMIRMQEEIPGFDFNRINELAAKPDGLLDLLYVLAENGAKATGTTLDVDKDWFALHIPANAKSLIRIQVAVMDTLTDGMMMETEEDEELNEEVDVVLQEIQKKSETTSSPGEKSSPGE